jgi:hypothetical protein
MLCERRYCWFEAADYREVVFLISVGYLAEVACRRDKVSKHPVRTIAMGNSPFCRIRADYSFVS